MRRGLGRIDGRGLVPLVRLGHGLRSESRTRKGSRPRRSALEKCTARFIVLAHADFLPIGHVPLDTSIV
jgi:hypothetical protein